MRIALYAHYTPYHLCIHCANPKFGHFGDPHLVQFIINPEHTVKQVLNLNCGSAYQKGGSLGNDSYHDAVGRQIRNTCIPLIAITRHWPRSVQFEPYQYFIFKAYFIKCNLRFSRTISVQSSVSSDSNVSHSGSVVSKHLLKRKII